MSAPSSLQSEEPFQCSICLEVFTDPVTIPCGHTFCKACIQTHWKGKEQFQCPLCQDRFNRRQELKVNIVVKEAVENFKARQRRNDQRQIAPPPATAPRSRFFTLKRLLVLVVLLVCLLYRRNPQTNLDLDQRRTCPVKDPEGGCQSPDQLKQPKPLGEWGKKVLRKAKDDMEQMIQERLMKLKEVKDSAELSKRVSETQRKARMQSIRDVKALILRSLSELNEVEDKQRAEDRRAEELVERLDQAIVYLQQRGSELEQISHTEDHLHLLQSESLPSTDWSKIRFYSDLSPLETVRRFLSSLVENLQSETMKVSHVELRTMQKYEVDVTLDPATAQTYLVLSEDGKQVRHGDTRQNLPDNPERFDPVVCVLGREGFSSGRFYYEVQVKDKTDWALAVARESINRKGEIILSPENGYWTVWLRDGRYEALASPSIPLSLSHKPQKVGVFVDYEEGQVSFYDVDNKSHIYSFTGQTFTEKLYPLFTPFTNNDGKNSAPLVITPLS